MADNIPTTTNASVATDDIGNVHFQRMKLTLGADGVNDGDVSAVNPMPVEMVSGVGLTDAELRATPVDVAGTVSVDDSTPISVAVDDSTPISVAVDDSTPISVAVDDSTPISVAVDGTVPVSVAAILDVEQQPPLVVEKIDQASATVTYIGQAAPGTATSAASWRIQRMSVSGTVTTLAYADGDLNFNNIWDNRSSLTYT